VAARSFADAVDAFARSLTESFGSVIAGDPEDQLKAPMQALLKVGGRALGFSVIARTESRVAGLSGRPDVGVGVGGLLAGYVELKAPGKGARPHRFKATDAIQWRKFQSLPNLIYTDGNEWALFREGEQVGALIRTSGDVTADGTAAFDPDQKAELELMFRNFLSWYPVTPTTPKALAQTLAPLCRLLREDALIAVQRPGSALELLVREWRTYLFPDADDGQFADAYAQTLTYAPACAVRRSSKPSNLAPRKRLTVDTACWHRCYAFLGSQRLARRSGFLSNSSSA
jgi:hypothetical protein